MDEPQKYCVKWNKPDQKKKKPTKISLKCTSLKKEEQYIPGAWMGMGTGLQIGMGELMGVTEYSEMYCDDSTTA